MKLIGGKSRESVHPCRFLGLRYSLSVGWNVEQGARLEAEANLKLLLDSLASYFSSSPERMAPFLYEWGEIEEDEVEHSPCVTIIRAHQVKKSAFKMAVDACLQRRTRERKNIQEENQQLAEKLNDIFEEDEAIWELVDFLFDYFEIYLEGACTPYFFMYRPDTRSFCYRGILATETGTEWWAGVSGAKLRETMNTLDWLTNEILLSSASTKDEREKRFADELIVRMAMEEGKGLNATERYLYVIEHIEQQYDEGINRILYENEVVLKTVDWKRDFGHLLDPDPASKLKSLREFLESKVMMMGETPSHAPLHMFVPIKWGGQLRGTLFMRGTSRELIDSRLTKTAELIAEVSGGFVDQVYTDIFRYRMLHPPHRRGRRVGELILENICRLFNAEIAGYTRLKGRSDGAIGVTEESEETIGLKVEEQAIYGFMTAGGLFRKIAHGDGQSDWQSLYSKMPKTERTYRPHRPGGKFDERYVYLDFNGGYRSRDDIVSGLKERQIPTVPDLRQFAASIRPWNRNESGNTEGKTVLTWKVRRQRQRSREVYCFWVALDAALNMVNLEEERIDRKCRAVADVLEFIRAEEDEQRKLALLVSRSVNHDVKNLWEGTRASVKDLDAQWGALADEERRVRVRDIIARVHLGLFAKTFGISRTLEVNFNRDSEPLRELFETLWDATRFRLFEVVFEPKVTWADDSTSVPRSMEVVLANLILNAMHASKRNCHEVMVLGCDIQEDSVSFSVKNKRALPQYVAEELSRAIPLEMPEESRGLWICRRIVSDLNGNLAVSAPEPDFPTVIRIQIPKA